MEGGAVLSFIRIASDNPIEIDQDNATISFQDFKVTSGTLMQLTCNDNTKDKKKL